jgi:LacI family transcriptional regulator
MTTLYPAGEWQDKSLFVAQRRNKKQFLKRLSPLKDFLPRECLVASRSKLQKNRENHPSPLPRPHHLPHVLLLVETTHAYGRGIVEGIARYALENGPWSIQFELQGLDALPPKWLKNWSGDGIITRTISLKSAKLLWATHLPIVEMLGSPKIGTAQVLGDFDVMAQMAAEHFLSCGLRQFAYFTTGEVFWIKTHRDAFQNVIAEKGYTCHCYHPPISAQAVPHWDERQRPRLIKWIHSLPRPIGIFVSGDSPALPLLDVCRELHIAVPEEIAILAVGNDPVICETVHPTLSSLDLDARRIGYEAARLLDQKMAGKKTKEIVRIPPSRVVVRQSTDLMVIPDADMVQAMRFIRDFACKGITVSRVTEEVGLSLSVLERRFHQYLGRTPKAEIMRVQIEHAKVLLARTDKTSGSIAHQCGFHSLQYFTNAFSHKVGMTPHAYRRRHRISRDLDNMEL